MTVTPASLQIRFPEFTCVDPERIQLFIDDAIILLNESYWGEKYDLGISYLAAHYIALGAMSEGGVSSAKNPVSAKAVDGVSVTFATPTIDDGSEAYYSSTQYGQRYLALMKTLGIPAYVI